MAYPAGIIAKIRPVQLILRNFGFIPVASSFSRAPVAQLDRVLDYESSGRRFDSFPARQFKDGIPE